MLHQKDRLGRSDCDLSRRGHVARMGKLRKALKRKQREAPARLQANQVRACSYTMTVVQYPEVTSLPIHPIEIR